MCVYVYGEVVWVCTCVCVWGEDSVGPGVEWTELKTKGVNWDRDV